MRGRRQHSTAQQAAAAAAAQGGSKSKLQAKAAKPFIFLADLESRMCKINKTKQKKSDRSETVVKQILNVAVCDLKRVKPRCCS